MDNDPQIDSNDDLSKVNSIHTNHDELVNSENHPKLENKQNTKKLIKINKTVETSLISGNIESKTYNNNKAQTREEDFVLDNYAVFYEMYSRSNDYLPHEKKVKYLNVGKDIPDVLQYRGNYNKTKEEADSRFYTINSSNNFIMNDQEFRNKRYQKNLTNTDINCSKTLANIDRHVKKYFHRAVNNLVNNFSSDKYLEDESKEYNKKSHEYYISYHKNVDRYDFINNSTQKTLLDCIKDEYNKIHIQKGENTTNLHIKTPTTTNSHYNQKDQNKQCNNKNANNKLHTMFYKPYCDHACIPKNMNLYENNNSYNIFEYMEKQIEDYKLSSRIHGWTDFNTHEDYTTKNKIHKSTENVFNTTQKNNQKIQREKDKNIQSLYMTTDKNVQTKVRKDIQFCKKECKRDNVAEIDNSVDVLSKCTQLYKRECKCDNVTEMDNSVDVLSKCTQFYTQKCKHDNVTEMDNSVYVIIGFTQLRIKTYLSTNLSCIAMYNVNSTLIDFVKALSLFNLYNNIEMPCSNCFEKLHEIIVFCIMNGGFMKTYETKMLRIINEHENVILEYFLYVYPFEQFIMNEEKIKVYEKC